MRLWICLNADPTAFLALGVSTMDIQTVIDRVRQECIYDVCPHCAGKIDGFKPAQWSSESLSFEHWPEPGENAFPFRCPASMIHYRILQISGASWVPSQ